MACVTAQVPNLKLWRSEDDLWPEAWLLVDRQINTVYAAVGLTSTNKCSS